MGQTADALDPYRDPARVAGDDGYVVGAGADPVLQKGTDYTDGADSAAALAATGDGDATGPQTDEIRADIEQTRAEMSATIDAIQGKLNPQNLVEQAKESVREATVGRVEQMVSNASDTARETGSGIMELIKKNPLPVALAGLGLGWFFLKNRNSGGGTGNRYPGAWNGPSGYYGPPPGYPAGNSGGGWGYPPPPGARGYAEGESVSFAPPPNPPASSGSAGLPGQIMDLVRENPLPAAVAGLSIGYMVMKAQSGGSNGNGNGHWSTGGAGVGPGANPVGQAAGQVRAKVSNLADQAGNKAGQLADQAGQVASQAGDLVGQAGDKVGQVASQAGDLVGQAGDKVGQVASQATAKVGDLAGQAGDTAGQLANTVQYQAQRATTQFQQTMMDNPLAVGVVAFAVGAALGLVVPETQPEHRLMGEMRDNLVQKAQGVAQDTMDKVQRVASDVGQTVQQTVQQGAREQGLTT